MELKYSMRINIGVIGSHFDRIDIRNLVSVYRNVIIFYTTHHNIVILTKHLKESKCSNHTQKCILRIVLLE